MCRTRIFIVLLFVTFFCFPSGAAAQRSDRPVIIEWPSGGYRTIQEAVDALPADGGVLQIAEGEYLIENPIVVTGKRIVIKGGGSGMKIKKRIKYRREAKSFRNRLVITDDKPFTQLIGPEPRPVFDGRGEVILPADRAEGMFNFIAADAVVRDMRISGFDSGIVDKDDDLGNSAPLVVTNVLITDTGRGITSLSSGDMVVQSSAVEGAEWHGVVKSPPVGSMPKAVLKDLFIKMSRGVGIYFNNTYGYVSFGDVTGAQEGAISCFECDLIVLNSHLHSNYKYGVLLLLAKNASDVLSNDIEDTRPDMATGGWGDGVVNVLSEVHVNHNRIKDSSRAGVSNFGGHAMLADNTLQCAGFELEGEPYMGHDFKFDDNLGNLCGCPKANGYCAAESVGLEPPEPTAPIE